MTDEPRDDRTAMAIGFAWASRVTTISLEMVLPGLIGYWIDQQLGTKAVFLLLGFAIGMTLAVLHLVKIASSSGKPDRRSKR